MAMQSRRDIDTSPFIKHGNPYAEHDCIIQAESTRTQPLQRYTVMAKIATTQKWVPFSNESAADGSGIPRGIYIGADIPANKLTAGDIQNSVILVGGGVTVDKYKIIIENNKSLDTVIKIYSGFWRTVKDCLVDIGIYLEDTIDVSQYEN